MLYRCCLGIFPVSVRLYLGGRLLSCLVFLVFEVVVKDSYDYVVIASMAYYYYHLMDSLGILDFGLHDKH